MRIQPIKLPTLTLSEPCNYKLIAALTILAGSTATFQSKNRGYQNRAGVNPMVSATHEGTAPNNAINCAEYRVMQTPSLIHQAIMNTPPCVFIVDDDYAVRDGLGLVVETTGLACQTFESAEQFLQAYSPDMSGCLLLDVSMPGLSGLELQDELIHRHSHLPIIFITAHSDALMKVRALNAGAADFLTKPVPSNLLIERIKALLYH